MPKCVCRLCCARREGRRDEEIAALAREIVAAVHVDDAAIDRLNPGRWDQ